MIPPSQRLARVTLELSLKPFLDLSDAGIDATCDRLWRNWRRLAARADALALLLWVGTGDEVLTWSGRDDDVVPTTTTIGFNNMGHEGAYDPANEHYQVNRAQPYHADPPTVRYGDLKRIIGALRRTGKAVTGLRPSVGATIDPGPEFAPSPWRYEHHREVLQTKLDRLPYPMWFITHQATLEADDAVYAAFPDGLPGGTGFGTFLGRQFEAARRKLGFDFIWLSNGLGYSHHPWISRGDLFDGQAFHPDRAAEQLERTNRFWRDFRAESDAPIEVRGTNFTVGMDLAADGCSLADIAEIGGLERPPCNPPWGSRALGMEMASYLSRLAKTPTDRLPFRFYLNDPWFAVVPWYDYYAQEPFDCYVPMAASRLNGSGGVASGGVDAPTDLNLLTIDTAKGELLEDQAGEFTPHLLAALDTRPDAAGPVVWVYPFTDYDAVLKQTPERLNHLFAHDWFVSRAIDGGLPLNTVCDADRFVRLRDAGRLPDAVFVAPVPVGDWAYGGALLELVNHGGRVILFGSTEHAPAPLREALGLTHATPIEGTLAFDSSLPSDWFDHATPSDTGIDPAEAVVGMEVESGASKREATERVPLIHRALTSGGGVLERCDDVSAVRATVRLDGEERAYAVVRSRPEWRGGQLAWVRSTVGFDPASPHLEAKWDPPSESVNAAEMMRPLLGELGWRIVQHRHDPAARPAQVFIKRSRGGWYVVGHKPDTSVRLWIAGPDGAPVYEQCETPIVDGLAGESFGKSFHKRANAFVTMPDGVVSVSRLTVPVGKRYHFSIGGLDDAAVTLYPDPAAGPLENVTVRPQLRSGSVEVEPDRNRHALRVPRHTGTLYVAW